MVTRSNRAMREWSLSDTATEQELALLSDGVLEVGRAVAVDGNARPLSCLVREGGSIIAGGCGRTEFERLFVQYLWAAERCRGRGLGSEVLSRLEAEARQRGSRDALIETP